VTPLVVATSFAPKEVLQQPIVTAAALVQTSLERHSLLCHQLPQGRRSAKAKSLWVSSIPEYCHNSPWWQSDI
jgi:hypothetical protein